MNGWIAVLVHYLWCCWLVVGVPAGLFCGGLASVWLGASVGQPSGGYVFWGGVWGRPCIFCGDVCVVVCFRGVVWSGGVAVGCRGVPIWFLFWVGRGLCALRSTSLFCVLFPFIIFGLLISYCYFLICTSVFGFHVYFSI